MDMMTTISNATYGAGAYVLGARDALVAQIPFLAQNSTLANFASKVNAYTLNLNGFVLTPNLAAITIASGLAFSGAKNRKFDDVVFSTFLALAFSTTPSHVAIPAASLIIGGIAGTVKPLTKLKQP
jgi:hypothetical protein